MVGVTGQDRQGPVGLFGDEDPNQLVGQGGGAERKPEIRSVAEDFIPSIRATGGQHYSRHGSVPGLADTLRKGGACHGSTLLVEGDEKPGSRPELCLQGHGFLTLALFRRARMRLADLDGLDR